MSNRTRHLHLWLIGLVILASVGTSAWHRGNAAGGLSAQEATGSWRLVRTPNSRGGPEAVSIMHTADTSRSDLDFAGLMIRCNGGKSELVIVLLKAFPLRAHPRVIFGNPGQETQFDATIGPPGTAVILPEDPKVVVGRAWPTESDLFVRIVDGPTNVSGVVPLTGLQSAFAGLMANCPIP